MVKMNKALAKLAPTWAKKLSTKEKLIDAYDPCTIDDRELAIGSEDACILGEVFRWSDSYACGPKECATCRHYSMEFYRAIKHDYDSKDWMQMQAMFMRHWKITHKGKRR